MTIRWMSCCVLFLVSAIGVREAALVSLLAQYGAPREDVFATGLLWQGVLAVSGLGGLVVTQWLRRSASRRTASAQDRS